MNFDQTLGLYTEFEKLCSAIDDSKDLKEVLKYLQSCAVGGPPEPPLLEKYPAILSFLQPLEKCELKSAFYQSLDIMATALSDRLENEQKRKEAEHSLALASGELPPPTRSSAATPPPCDIDVPSILSHLMNEDTLPPESTLIGLARAAKKVLETECNVIGVKTPCVVVGDVHGNITDLLQNILKLGGDFKQTKYLFLGDYVDRGEAGIRCIAILFAAKIVYPANVFLIRGNHESRQTNSMYGFLAECLRRFPATPGKEQDSFSFDHPIWAVFNEAFDALPLAAVIDNVIFSVHGGFSPSAQKMESLLCVNRHEEGTVMADLTWSDPGPCQGCIPNARGTGQVFGEDATKAFLDLNKFKFICRAHQCVREGYRWEHGDKVLTVFSASNYCGMGNKGAVLFLDTNLSTKFSTYEPQNQGQQQVSPSQALVPEYFTAETEEN